MKTKKIGIREQHRLDAARAELIPPTESFLDAIQGLVKFAHDFPLIKDTVMAEICHLKQGVDFWTEVQLRKEIADGRRKSKQ